MSRRRFGDADDTYKDFISAIDDHKRKQIERHREQKEAAMQQAAAQQQHMQTATSINYQGSSAVGGGVGQVALHPYASILNDEPSSVGHDSALSSHSLAQSPLDDEEDFSHELPLGATDKEILSAARGSMAHGRNGSGNGSGRNLRPSSIAASALEDEPLLHGNQPHSVNSGGGGGGGGGEPSSDASWLTRRNLDLVVQKKSLYIFLNGMFGLALMFAILEVCWSPAWIEQRFGQDMSCPQDYYSNLEWVRERNSIRLQPIPSEWSWNAVADECPTPIRSAVTETLKIILTISTLILCWQLLDRKKLQVNIKFREQRRRLKAKGFNGSAADREYNAAHPATVTTFGLLSLSPNNFRWDVWLQLLVCLIQPIPFTHQLTGGAVDDSIGLLMWLRVFLAFRVIRDYSEIWLNRRSIKHQSSFQTKVPDFDSWLSCKTISYRSPMTFALSFWAVTVIIFGHALYVAERDRLPDYFNVWTGVFCSFQIVSIGWPADVWEIFMPISILGKMVSMFAGIAGLILISFIIVTVGSALYPSKFEENALNYIAMDKVRQQEREGSAALIQFVWKNAARESELAAKLAPKNPALYAEISEAEEKQFMENFIAKSKELRHIRRERAELEERSDPTSEINISPMDQYFDTKLEAIRTDIQHQNAKNNQQFMTVLATLNQLIHKTKEKSKQAPPTITTTGQTSGKKQRGTQAEKKMQEDTLTSGQTTGGEASSSSAADFPLTDAPHTSQQESDMYAAALAESMQQRPVEYTGNRSAPRSSAHRSAQSALAAAVADEEANLSEHSDEGQAPGEQ